MKKQRKLLLGSKAIESGWGVQSKSRGMYSGGYTRWLYGIKGLFTYKILECWGDFRDMKV